MEELSELCKQLDLNINEYDIDYEFINVFKNPQKLPITQVHLERLNVKLKKGHKLGPTDVNLNAQLLFDKNVEVLPALDAAWIRFSSPSFEFISTEEDFVENNKNFLKTLYYLIQCNYHQFWCLILFKPEIAVSLRSLLLNPIISTVCLNGECLTIYQAVLTSFQLVYQRLITYIESATEYMPQDSLMKFLLDLKLINLPIVITLLLLYEKTHREFTNKLVEFYFSYEPQARFINKEVEEMVEYSLVALEVITGNVCGFQKNAVIVPIAIEPKPKVFSLDWIQSVTNYLFNTVASLRVLLQSYKDNRKIALKKNIAFRLSFFYENTFTRLYELMDEREELKDNIEKSVQVYLGMSLARSQFLEVFNLFVSGCLNDALELMGNSEKQEEIVELYIKLFNSAVEDEYFICDYDEIYNIELQNDMLKRFTNLDPIRINYIIDCIHNFSRHNRLLKAMKSDEDILRKTIEKYGTEKTGVEALFSLPKPTMENEKPPIELTNNSTECNGFNFNPTEDEIEDLIKTAIDMFPHLGDGFVLKCLEAYNYQVNDVISAILEYNLPPHIVDIPFDQIRIPPEQKPPSPILAYKGKRPDYDDALTLLNDKRDMKEIKTFVLEGIEYTNKYDIYDDEYDDRLDEETIPVPEYGEDVLKFNPNYEELVSDTSHSENEYDDHGEMVDNLNKPKPFCEDPAVLRERRERQLGIHRNRTDVKGKPKEQGQDKDVVRNRQKKNVNKSSRANHNRKSGAQWKRSKGMFPS